MSKKDKEILESEITKKDYVQFYLAKWSFLMTGKVR